MRIATENAGPVVKVTSLYSYTGRMRALIHHAKVKGDLKALADLAGMFCSHPAVLAGAANADLVIPCPSSLWGRMRGRLDIAWHLAHQTGRLGNLQILAAPPHLHWRLRKRARMAARDRRNGAGRPGHPGLWRLEAVSRRMFGQRLLQHGGSQARILLIDDVLTTGATLTSLAREVGVIQADIAAGHTDATLLPQMTALILARSVLS